MRATHGKGWQVIMLGSNQPWTKICLITILPKLLVADRRSLKLNWKKILKRICRLSYMSHIKPCQIYISTFIAGTENLSQMVKCTVHLKFSPFYISVENMDGNRKWGLSGELFLVHFSCWWFAELWTVDILQAKQSGGLPCLPLCGDQPMKILCPAAGICPKGALHIICVILLARNVQHNPLSVTTSRSQHIQGTQAKVPQAS